ncbi:MAG: hypothetical protein U0R44_05530 [Candidatus Micrarchaeia archaeon]
MGVVLSFAHFILEAKVLFVGAGGAMSVNLAELSAVVIGVAARAPQIAGFLIRKERQANHQKVINRRA